MNKYKLTLFALSNKGKLRKKNEDAVFIDRRMGLAMVADGMGGHASGEVASAMAVRVISDKLRDMVCINFKPDDYDEEYSLEANQLALAGRFANSEILAAGNAVPENNGMGTTLSAIILSGEKIAIAHIGDSRVYIFRNGILEQMTEDHSVAMEHVRKGIITSEQAEKSPFQNALTRALGVQKDPVVDLKEVLIKENDRFLLCTDGLSNALKTEDIAGILKDTPDGQTACELLVRAANNNGGLDNITVAFGILKKKRFLFW